MTGSRFDPLIPTYRHDEHGAGTRTFGAYCRQNRIGIPITVSVLDPGFGRGHKSDSFAGGGSTFLSFFLPDYKRIAGLGGLTVKNF